MAPKIEVRVAHDVGGDDRSVYFRTPLSSLLGGGLTAAHHPTGDPPFAMKVSVRSRSNVRTARLVELVGKMRRTRHT